MWHLGWTKWHWDRSCPKYFVFPSVSFHQCSILILHSQNSHSLHHFLNQNHNLFYFISCCWKSIPVFQHNVLTLSFVYWWSAEMFMNPECLLKLLVAAFQSLHLSFHLVILQFEYSKTMQYNTKINTWKQTELQLAQYTQISTPIQTGPEAHPASCKGKAIPLQAWTDPEGSRRLRLPDFQTIGTWRW
jgi:hypothetical protein